MGKIAICVVIFLFVVIWGVGFFIEWEKDKPVLPPSTDPDVIRCREKEIEWLKYYHRNGKPRKIK